MPIPPREAKSISTDELISLQFETPHLVVPRRGIATTEDIGFSVANGAGAGLAELFLRQVLLDAIGPGEGEFAPEGSHRHQL
jgi:hypothetical protein